MFKNTIITVLLMILINNSGEWVITGAWKVIWFVTFFLLCETMLAGFDVLLEEIKEALNDGME